MTRDEIQKLIGGYATGSLTEAERKLLFDAALEDQELFDQLAQEQALKEMLEEPGVKPRLIAALDREKPRQVLWWPWVTAAVTASLAIVIGGVMLRTPEKPQQIAAVSKVAEAPAPVVQSEPVAPLTAPATETATAPAPKPQPEKLAKDAPAPRVFAPPAPEKGPPPPTAPIELPKEEKALEPAASPPVVAAPKDLILGFQAADESAQQQAGQIGGRAFIGGAPAGIAPAAPAAPAGGGGGRGGGGGGGGAGAAKGGGRGGRGGAGAPQAAARAVATRFAFDYSFDDTGALRIIPAAPGSLSMTVPAQPAPSVLLPARNVVPGTPVVVPIPPGVTEVIVSFTGSPVAVINGAVVGTPVRRDEAAGTVEDQSPPNQRILVTIPVKP